MEKVYLASLMSDLPISIAQPIFRLSTFETIRLTSLYGFENKFLANVVPRQSS
jgi:hypothetical protein